MRKYDGILFDLDGTLLDTAWDLTDAVNYLMNRYGLEQKTVNQVKSFAGNGIRKLIERCVPLGEDHPDFEEMFQGFRSYYTDHCLIKTCPYEGITNLLEQLARQGYLMGIVSNKNQKAVEELNQKYFKDTISEAIGQSSGVLPKPAPDSVYKALESIGCRPQRTLYVGDSEVDKMTADNAGMDCVLVSWGFRPKEQLCQLSPAALIDRAEQLLDYLKE